MKDALQYIFRTVKLTTPKTLLWVPGQRLMSKNHCLLVYLEYGQHCFTFGNFVISSTFSRILSTCLPAQEHECIKEIFTFQIMQGNDF